MSTQITESSQVQYLLRSQISPGALNVRKTFDHEAINGLADSIREFGFKTSGALLVRRIPEELRVEITSAGNHIVQRLEAEGWFTLHECRDEEDACQKLVDSARFEIIWGERRWHASGIVGMERVPAVVEEHTDMEVLELNLVENLQREDLNPIEEAQGFHRILSERDGAGKPIHTTESLARRIGRSKAYVDESVVLVRLAGTTAGEAIISGALGASVGRRIAGLATPKVIEEVTQKVLNNPYGPSPMPRQQLEDMIRDDYQKELRGSGFDPEDANLLPVQVDADGRRLLGGSCADCPYNTRNIEGASQKRLWQCTNVECYAEKKRLSFEQWRSRTASEDGAVVALSAEENAQLWEFNGTVLNASASAKYVDLDARPVVQDLRAGVMDPEPWKKLIKDQQVTVFVALDEQGQERKLVARPVALSAAQQNGHDIFRTPVKKAKKATEDVQAENIAAKVAKEREGVILSDQDAALREGVRGITSLTDGGFPLVAQVLIITLAQGSLAKLVAGYRGWEDDGKVDAEEWLEKYAKKLEAAQRLPFLIEMVVALQTPPDKWRQAWAKELKVDLKAIRKTCEERFAAQDKEAAEKSGLEKGLHWPKKRTELTDFPWNGSNVCTDPDMCEVGLPTPDKVTAIVSVARSEKGWHFGLDLCAKNSTGQSKGPNRTHAAYSSRELALRTGLLAIQDWLKPQGLAASLTRVKEYLALLSTPKKPKTTPEERLAARAGVVKKPKPKGKPKAKAAGKKVAA